MAIPTPQAWGTAGVRLAADAAAPPGAPASVAQGDILWLVIEDQGSDASTSLATVAGGTETWNQHPSSPQFSSGATRLYLYWARASQASPTMPNIGGGNNHTYARVARTTGGKSSGNPWNGSEYNAGADAATNPTIPGFATGGVDRLILDFVSTGYNGSSTARFSGWTNSSLASPAITEWSDETNTIGGGGGVGSSYGGMASAGTVGSTTVTEAFAGHGYIKVAMAAAADPQSVTGVALAVTPSLPAGELQAAGQQLTGVALSTTPSEPAGRLDHALPGVALAVTPSLPSGRAYRHPVGVALSVTPTLPVAAATHNVLGAAIAFDVFFPPAVVTHNPLGVALVVGPSLPAGNAGPGVIGVAIAFTPSLPVASIEEIQIVTGVALEVTPSLPFGQLDHALVGFALAPSPSLPVGRAYLDPVGVALVITPTLPVASVSIIGTVFGVALETTPTLPAGRTDHAILGTADIFWGFDPFMPPAVLTVPVYGVALAVTPTLPAAALAQQVLGVALVVMPDEAFYDDPDVYYDDDNYTYEGLYVGYAPTARLLVHPVGVALVVTPSLPAADISLYQVYAVALSFSPSLPAGSASEVPALGGVALVVTVQLPAGIVGIKGRARVIITMYNRAVGTVDDHVRAAGMVRQARQRALVEVE